MLDELSVIHIFSDFLTFFRKPVYLEKLPFADLYAGVMLLCKKTIKYSKT